GLISKDTSSIKNMVNGIRGAWTRNQIYKKPEKPTFGRPLTTTLDHWPIVYKDCVPTHNLLLYKYFISELWTFTYIGRRPDFSQFYVLLFSMRMSFFPA